MVVSIGLICLPVTWNVVLLLDAASAVLGLLARTARRTADRVERLAEVRKVLRNVTEKEYIVSF